MNQDKNNIPESKKASRKAEEISLDKTSNSPSFGGGRGEAGASSPIIKDDEIDLIALVKTIWDGRKTIFYAVGICVFIGLVYAFTSPAKYSASATLLPSAEKKSGSLGNLSVLAGMAGINLGAMMGDASAIPAEIYPQVVNSYPFLNELIHEKFNFEEYPEPVSLYNYVVADTIESLGAKLAKYTIKFPWTLKDAILSGNDEKEGERSVDYGVLKLTEEELKAIGSIQDLIQIEVDNKTGLVSIAVEASEPVLTAQYVQKAVDLLQKYVIDYKTQQVQQNLEFVQQRFDEKKAEYESAREAFYDYKDRHRNMISERIDAEYQRLSDAYDIASAVYKGLAQQLEQAKIAVKEETPVFTILDPAKVSYEKSAPRKKIIVLMFLFFGVFIGVGLVLVKVSRGNIRTTI
ncbi:LPS O-antigen chain length determinant protein, WzzB/FepE family [Saccharicrinis carchari]|uniref:LPS O-antigen chain length determinant protein, WzzB/FepE family n=1 Tax=Saccharicrinis carchari TaxID=1168039 RepID=A0A521EVL7_SACCC|nr:Wzz/FepE/Etk N-terminal domain-containing protein [Saccharicrinis carchari]SMO87963.1 LPS O-antigen chain length determinant protein, WzzB/FepE family [Saccharicrinis carchari]